eukprot:CCRYP_000094-RB/>CCRYP_000094-RB protein AED:0.21 eAED:0.31 QI:0/0/0.5/1/0/0/2/1668/87
MQRANQSSRNMKNDRLDCFQADGRMFVDSVINYRDIRLKVHPMLQKLRVTPLTLTREEEIKELITDYLNNSEMIKRAVREGISSIAQ